MRWIERNSLLFVAAIILGAGATTGVALADILVLRSNGPIARRLPAGSLLPGTRPIRLAAGDTLELLGETGTWTWRGPGDFPRTAAAAQSASKMATPDSRRERLGGTRTGRGSPPYLWMVDVATSGTVCVLAGVTPLLWRMEAENADVAALVGPNGVAAEVAWAPGQAAVAWPETVPVVDGASYRLTAGSATTSLVIRLVDTAPTSAPQAGLILLEKGCDAQMALLVAGMPEQEELAGS